MSTSTTTTGSVNVIVEGSCSMRMEDEEERGGAAGGKAGERRGPQPQSVFYNPVQVQNRDLSILMIALYAERRAVRMLEHQRKLRLKKHPPKEQQPPLEPIPPTSAIQELLSTAGDSNLGISILDGLAASGLRSIRYWNEIQGVRHVTINDMEAAAVRRAHDNLRHNNLEICQVPRRSDAGIRVRHGDVLQELYSSRPVPPSAHDSSNHEANHDLHQPYQPYHVIDLDPYGSAAMFLDAAVQATVDNVSQGDTVGFLCVTCTDMVALGGSHPETAFGRYCGSMPIPRAGYLQEMAIRILLYSLAVTAAKYGKVIRPILSVGMDFYVRVFVEIYTDRAAINRLSVDCIGYVYQSTQCPSFHVVPAGRMGGTNGKAFQPGRMPTATTTSKYNTNLADDSCTTGVTTHSTPTDTASDRAARKLQKKFKKDPNLRDCDAAGDCKTNQFNQSNQHIGFCEETGATFKIGGPIWIGPMHDATVVQEALQRLRQKNGALQRSDQPTQSSHPDLRYLATAQRLRGLLLSCADECTVHTPLFYRLPDLARTVNASTPPLQLFQNALRSAGYTVAGYHKDPHAIKTDAPNRVIWDILRLWVKHQHHQQPQKQPTNSVAHKILSIEPILGEVVDFSAPIPRKKTATNEDHNVARFPVNPQPHWGPKPAAKGYKKQTKRSVLHTVNTVDHTFERTSNDINNNNQTHNKRKEPSTPEQPTNEL